LLYNVVSRLMPWQCGFDWMNKSTKSGLSIWYKLVILFPNCYMTLNRVYMFFR
jgi:hypothetical protein